MYSSEDILQKIRAEHDQLSPAFRQISEFLISEPSFFINSSMKKLSQIIGISEPTLIRFARHYGYSGLPDFRIAFAMSLAVNKIIPTIDLEPRLQDKQAINIEVKRAIGELALSLTEKDSSILLDSGSTVQCLAEALVTVSAKTILTTSINIVLALRQADQHQVIIPGGAFRHRSMSLTGRMAEANLSDMRIDTVYLGGDSIHPEFGLSTYSEEEAHLNRAMMRASKRVVLLADSSKFTSPALHHICDLSEIDIIVSDTNLPIDMRNFISENGSKLILAELLGSVANTSII